MPGGAISNRLSDRLFIQRDSASAPHEHSKSEHPHEEEEVRRHIDRHRQSRKSCICDHDPGDHCGHAPYEAESTDPFRIRLVNQQRFSIHDAVRPVERLTMLANPISI